jgi:cold shock CspA family protein
MHAERGFGCIQDVRGGHVFSLRSALTPPESFATLKIGIGVEFEPKAGPKGPCTAKTTVTFLEAHSVLSCNELAACFQRHTAG